MSATPESPKKTLRQIYREERQRRQNTVFATIIAIMAALVVFSLLVLVGVLPMPFSEFSHDKDFAETGDIPCPTENAKPVPPDQVRLQILNATDRPGLASEVADALKVAGYQTAVTGNYTVPFRGSVEIDTGSMGVDSAYTISRYFEEFRLRLTDEPTNTVTIIIGDAYGDTASKDAIKKIAAETDKQLEPVPNCKIVKPVEEGEKQEQQSGSESGEQSGTDSES